MFFDCHVKIQYSTTEIMVFAFAFAELSLQSIVDVDAGAWELGAWSRGDNTNCDEINENEVI